MLKHSLLAVALALGITEPALSDTRLRSFYPNECVAIDQCAPVDGVTWLVQPDVSTTQRFVSSVHGRAFVPRNFPVRESKDERVHVCLRYDPFGSLEVTCLLVPARIF
jgi:hypothetical protein